VLCRQVLKVVVRKVVVGKTVVSLKKLLCCGLFLRWHLRATIVFDFKHFSEITIVREHKRV